MRWRSPFILAAAACCFHHGRSAPENDPPEAAHGDGKIDRADDEHGQEAARQTRVRSAPRNSTACAKVTKCGVGLIVLITYCSQTGMLSIGVLPPESSWVAARIGIASSRTDPWSSRVCRGGFRGRQPRRRRGPRQGGKKKRPGNRRADPPMDDELQRQHCGHEDDKAIGQHLGQHDLRRHHRHDQKMLSVPCSRSRISAAPVRITVKSVI